MYSFTGVSSSDARATPDTNVAANIATVMTMVLNKRIATMLKLPSGSPGKRYGCHAMGGGYPAGNSHANAGTAILSHLETADNDVLGPYRVTDDQPRLPKVPIRSEEG